MEEFKRSMQRRFYDSHPSLPLDPDSVQPTAVRPMHTDWAHISVVAFGAFFGALARYQIGLWLPTPKNGWPTAIFVSNIFGAFLLGFLLQALLRRGKDEGRRRVLRLMLGTGFLGTFTTYSSLATSTALLTRDGYVYTALAYSVVSVLGGAAACAFGIWLATAHHKIRTRGSS